MVEIMHQSFNITTEADVTRGLETLVESPMNVNLTACVHASGSFLLRDHPQIGEAQVRARSFIHSARALFSQLPHEVLLQKVNAQINELEKPQSGRQHPFS